LSNPVHEQIDKQSNMQTDRQRDTSD